MEKLTDFKFARWAMSGNFVAQVLLCLLLFAGVSYVAAQYFHRIDLSSQHRYSLSPETRAYLERLERPVKVYVTIAPDQEEREMDILYNDVRGLLREYEYASRSSPNGGIDVEFVNIYQQRGKANLLAERYGIQQSDLILLVSGEKRRTVFPNDLYVMEGRTRKHFQGEKMLTGAILDVSGDQQKKLYFVTGHGQMRIDDVDSTRGLSNLADALRHRNFALRTIDLTTVSRIPDDADMVLMISPQGPILPQEEEILRNYMANNAGRLLIMLDHPGRRHGMDDLFFDWGVMVDNALVVDSGPDALAGGGDLLLRRFGDHAITRTLIDNQIPVLVGISRPVDVDPGRPITDSLQVQPLLGTSETSWGERNFTRSTVSFDPGVDLAGPLSVAVVAERQVSPHLPISIPGGRLLVFGTSDFISNNRIGALGNLTLFLNSLNWATDRDSMVNIPPRPIESMQLVLSREKTNQLRLSMLVLFPGAAALCGVLVFWVRRK